MEITQIYAFTAGGVLLTMVLARFAMGLIRFLRPTCTLFVLKHLVYPILIRHLRCSEPVSRYHFLLQFVYFVGTAVCNVVGVQNAAQASSCAAALSLINLVPLFLAGHQSFGAHLLGLSIETYRRMHRSIGFMVFLQGLIHVVVIVRSKGISVQDTPQLFGLLVRHCCSYQLPCGLT